MRKITALLLSLALILSAVACGTTVGTGTGSASSETASAVESAQSPEAGSLTEQGGLSTDQTGLNADDAAETHTDGFSGAAGNTVDVGAVSGESSDTSAASVSETAADMSETAATESASEAGTGTASGFATDAASEAATDTASGFATDAASEAATDALADGDAPAYALSVSPEQLLKDVKGTYDELFTVLCDPRYDQLWIDTCASIVGDEDASEWAEKLKSAYTGTIYGEEAEEAYKEDPENGISDCYFTEGVEQFVFDGERISGLDRKGEEVFSNEYTFLRDISVSGMTDGYVFETSDDDAGEFKYFVLFPDTPATSYHIKFRYGSDLDDLAKYNEGRYAYWFAAGIPDNCDEEMIGKAVRLFVEEKLAGEAREGGTVEIGTAEGLVNFAKSVCDGSKNGFADTTIELTDDIDCSGIEWVPIGMMNLEDVTDMSCMFQGTLNGKGHTISNITYISDEPVCGIGVIGINLGEVKHLTVENVNIRCTDTQSMAVGGVVGYNMYGTIRDVTLTGENRIAGVNAVGGIAGGSTGKLRDCHVDGTEISVLGDNDFSDGRLVHKDIAQFGGLIIGSGFGGTVKRCNAKGSVIAEGNEPVGLGGIAGCLEMMDTVENCTADVSIRTMKGGHAIGGLCGCAGTHTNGKVVEETEGISSTEYPAVIDSCDVTVKMDVPGATHVGGLVGTGLYYQGEETAFKIMNSKVKADITGAVTPGAAAGRAENSVIESCEADVRLDGKRLEDMIGKTAVMFESPNQGEAGSGSGN